MRVAITGANAGIGLRSVEHFTAAGHEVLALCRDLSRAETAFAGMSAAQRDRIQPIALDLSSSQRIEAAAQHILARGTLDALISNAAVFDQTVRTAQRSADGHELFWATNHLGPVELIARVSPALAAAQAPRVVLVASKGLITMPGLAIRFDALDDLSWFTPTKAYYHAKLAQVMTAVTLAERVGDRLEVSCLRVPAVRLDADRLARQPAVLRVLYAPKNRFAMPPEAVAEVYEQLVTRPRQYARGAEVYLDEKLAVVPLPRFARDAAHRERLWSLTQTTIGDPEWAWPVPSR